KGWMPQAVEDDNAEYTIENVRVNTYLLPNVNSVLAFTPEELGGNNFRITGTFPNIKQITKIVISLDGGMTWENRLPIQNDLVYTFSPIEEKIYTPVIQIEDEFYTTYTISLLPVQALGIKLSSNNEMMLVQSALQAVAESYEKQNIGIFSEYVSRDFSGNRTYLEEGVRFDFDMFLDIRLMLYVNRIEELPTGEFAVDIRWNKTQMPRKTMQEQRTSGNTTLLFVREDGKMKIKNMRGDMLYATLSPEIAEVSGKSVAVIDQIRQAHDQRNPIQPGAGETEESGGLGTSSTLSEQQGTVSVVAGSGAAGSKGFDLDTGQIVIASSASSDLLFEGALLFQDNGLFDLSAETFNALDTAPAVTGGAIGGDFINTLVGNVYVFTTSSGKYGKLQISSYTAGVNLVTTFKYAVQPDGSKNIAT
ncbi:MAG: hypothetical protein PHQ52_06490, partial [Candidatus Omnitrophica bacterium]|nr:hypothetical protein [Candidatus Omnitrophota bacterium]